MRPKVSAIIATRGNLDLDRCLQSIFAQGVDVEVIVVDQLGGTAAKESCERYPENVTWVTCNGHGSSLGRNVGLEYANGRYIFFPDDDCFYEYEFLRRALDAIERDHVDFVTGTSLDPETKRLNHTSNSSGELRRVLDHKNILYSFVEFTVVFRSSVFQRLRFDERIGTGSSGLAWSDEGADLLIRAMRAGMRGEFVPGLVAYHPDNAMVRNEHTMRRTFRYAVGRGRTLRRYWLGWGIFTREFCRPLGGMALYAVRFNWRWRYYLMNFCGKLVGLFYRPPDERHADS